MEFVFVTLRRAIEGLLSGEIDVWATLLRTLRLALESTFFALVFGLPVGVWIGAANTRVRRALVTLSNAGLGLPPVVLGVFIAVLFDVRNTALGRYELMNTFTATVIAQTLLALPIVIALTAAAVAALPAGLLDQARAFGASPLRRGVLAVREARVGVAAAAIAAVLSALAEVGAVIIVGGNIRGQTNTLASTIILDLRAVDTPGATANMLVLLLLVLIVGAALTVVQQRGAR